LNSLVFGTGVVGTLFAKATAAEEMPFIDLRRDSLHFSKFHRSIFKKEGNTNKQVFYKYDGEPFDWLIVATKYSNSFHRNLQELSESLGDMHNFRILLLQNGFFHVNAAIDIWGKDRIHWGTVGSLEASSDRNGIMIHNSDLPQLELELSNGIEALKFKNENEWLTIAYQHNVIFRKLPRWLIYSSLCSLKRLSIGELLRSNYQQEATKLIEEVNDALNGILSTPYSLPRFLNEVESIRPLFKPSSLRDLEIGREPEVYWVLLDLIRFGKERGVDMKISRDIAKSLKDQLK
jgi:ketopantoate reductase